MRKATTRKALHANNPRNPIRNVSKRKMRFDVGIIRTPSHVRVT
jgi:hypothetical protein